MFQDVSNIHILLEIKNISLSKLFLRLVYLFIYLNEDGTSKGSEHFEHQNFSWLKNGDEML